MIDGHLAPADLEAARRRVGSMVDAHCLSLHSDNRSQSAVVVLAPGRFDERQKALVTPTTAVVTADFVLWRWDDVEFEDLARRLPVDAVLVFLEPTADLGWRRLVHRLGRIPIRLLSGHDFESDVPARLRAAGLIVTNVDRFDLGPAGLRSYVWGRAEHIADHRSGSTVEDTVEHTVEHPS